MASSAMEDQCRRPGNWQLLSERIFDEAKAAYLEFRFATVFGYVTNGQYERAVGLFQDLLKVGLHRRFL